MENQNQENFDEDYDDQWDDTADGHGYDCDCDECQDDCDQEACGELPLHLGGGCSAAGSEQCDFECPFHDRVFGLVSNEEDDNQDDDDLGGES